MSVGWLSKKGAVYEMHRRKKAGPLRAERGWEERRAFRLFAPLSEVGMLSYCHVSKVTSNLQVLLRLFRCT